jgi:hypothetical protein
LDANKCRDEDAEEGEQGDDAAVSPRIFRSSQLQRQKQANNSRDEYKLTPSSIRRLTNNKPIAYRAPRIQLLYALRHGHRACLVADTRGLEEDRNNDDGHGTGRNIDPEAAGIF